MPRQLPWINKGARSRAQAKQPPAKKQRISAENDDSFFDGTILESSNRSTARARESDDDLPGLPAEPSTPRTKRRSKSSLYQKRDESSSPPLAQDLEQLPVVFMRKGVSKFDLRDDEWMMVEDELLETAKLFTRHLHIAEYERLKAKIEQKKKEAEASRPVVAGARMSADGVMRMRVKAQEKKQKKAIRDVFASQVQDDEEEPDIGLSSNTVKEVDSALANSRRRAHLASARAPLSYTVNNSDSDDLDAIHPPKPKPKSGYSSTTTTKATAVKSPPSNLRQPGAAHSAFAKPARPISTFKNRPSKTSRPTPFDMLDNYKPQKTSSAQPSGNTYRPQTTTISQKSNVSPSSPTKSSIASFDNFEFGESKQSANSLDGWGSSGVSKDTDDRLAKRRADREKEEKEKKRVERKAVRSDEIPTFLF